MIMTLDDFVREEKEKMSRFVHYWISNHQKDPELFPLEIPDDNSGVWTDMYNSFED